VGPLEALSLFELIDGEGKRLLLYPGDHGTEPEEAIGYSIEFVRRNAGANRTDRSLGLVASARLQRSLGG